MKTFSNPGPAPSQVQQQLKSNLQAQHARLEKTGSAVQSMARSNDNAANDAARTLPHAGPQAPRKR
jgi:hypothetical protein